MFEKMFGPKKSDKPDQGPSRREFLKSISAISVGAIIHGVVPDVVRASPDQALKFRIYKSVEKWNKEDWEKYKSIVSKSNVRGNLKYLKDQFKSANVSDLLLDAEDTLDRFDALLALEKSGADLASDSNKAQATFALEDYEKFYNPESGSETGQSVMESAKRNPPPIEGFEIIFGDKSKDLRSKLEKWFGKRWLYGSFSKLTYFNARKENKSFRVAGDFHGKDIGIYKSKMTEKEADFMRMMSHEIAHGHDWERTDVLSVPERLQFLRDVCEVFGSPDRSKDPYVEKDIPKECKDVYKMSPPEIEFTQLVEFWAVLNSIYDFPFLHKRQDEINLVEKWRRIILSRYPNL